MKLGERAAADIVVRHIQILIERGDLLPGDRLPPERALARQLGVSRPTVRAALRPLAALGVVRIRHGAGTFVTALPQALGSQSLTPMAALEGVTPEAMLEARGVLNVSVAGLAAERATDTQIASLAEEVTSLYASLDDAEAFGLHAQRFQQALAIASANPILVSFTAMVSALVGEGWREAVEQAPSRRHVAEAQRSVYQAVRAHDPGRAREAMSEHVSSAKATWCEPGSAAGARPGRGISVDEPAPVRQRPTGT